MTNNHARRILSADQHVDLVDQVQRLDLALWLPLPVFRTLPAGTDAETCFGLLARTTAVKDGARSSKTVHVCPRRQQDFGELSRAVGASIHHRKVRKAGTARFSHSPGRYGCRNASTELGEVLFRSSGKDHGRQGRCTSAQDANKTSASSVEPLARPFVTARCEKQARPGPAHLT
jgi:hypothetical protein